MSATHDIVILGGSYAGINVAHGLLKALPGLESSTGKNYKITMISNSTHFWFSVGAPRAMLIPYPQDIMDSFIPVTKGFSSYSSHSYKFVHAEITGLATNTREVIYKLKDANENISPDTKSLHFDTLVIATGSTGTSPLYALQGSHIPPLTAYKTIQSSLPSAKTILIVGGGPAGVETAGELGHLHGKNTSSRKDITILSGSHRLLPALRQSIGQRAQDVLEGMGVKVEHIVRLKNSHPTPNGKQTVVTLSDGTTRTVDLLLVATGRQPASSFLPSTLLSSTGHVVVDEYQRIPSLSSAYAVGDITTSANNPGGLIHLQTAGPTTTGNIVAELGGKGKGKVHKPMTKKEMQLVPLGPNGGVGAMFGFWAPSFAVKMIKSRNFFFPNAMKTVMGTA